MPRKPRIEVRQSSIEGRGVFALEQIERGTRIIEYRGQRISDEEADRRYLGRKDGRTYLFTIDDDTMIDAEVRGNDARFINHSCAPNCKSVMDGRRVWIQAKKRIKPGEELAYDYRPVLDGEIEDSDLDTHACACGSPKCRHTMIWLTTDAEKRLVARWAKARAKKAASRTNGHRPATAKKGA